VHPKFAKRIAQQVMRKKYERGGRLDLVGGWLVLRFPGLTKADGAEIRAELEKLDPSLKPKPVA